MGVGDAIYLAPLPCRPGPADEELEGEDRGREQCQAERPEKSPALERRFGKQPEEQEASQPKPGVAGVAKQHGEAANDSGTFREDEMGRDAFVPRKETGKPASLIFVGIVVFHPAIVSRRTDSMPSAFFTLHEEKGTS